MTEISSSSLIKADDKKTTPEKHDGTDNRTTTPSSSGSRIGDGAHHDGAGGATHDTAEDAFRAAIGLENGNRGNTRFTTEQFNREVGQGAGISRGQVVKYTDSDGNTIQGGQYHNKEGTFFKTPEGDTYKVQANDGRYTLQPTKEGQPPIQATQRDVVSNNFGRWGNRRNDDGDGSTPRGTDKTTPPATVPAASGDSGTTKPAADRTAPVVPAVDRNATPTASVDKAPAVTPALPVDRTPTGTTLGGGDRTTPAATSTPRLDPAAFYNSFKGASDQQQRDLLTSNLSGLPREQRADFIKQVADVAIRTDRANAGDVLNDIRQTARQVRSSLDNPVAQTATPPVGDKVAPATPAPVVKGVGDQPVVKGDQPVVKGDQPAVQPLQPSTQMQPPGQIKLDGGSLKGDNTGLPANAGQWVKGAMQGNGDNATPPAVRGADQPRVVTAVEGTLLGKDNKGNFAPGGVPGSDGGQNRGPNVPGSDGGPNRGPLGLPGQPGQGPIDPAVLVQRLQGDKGAFGGDGKGFQPVQLPADMTRGHGGDGKDNPGVQIAARGVGGDQPQSVMPQQKNAIPGMDLHDPQTRQFLADALKQIQATKVGDFDPRGQSQNLQDILKGFDQQKVERLQAFLNPDGKGQITDAAVGKLAALLNQPADRIGGNPVTDITAGQKMAIDRLTDLVRNNQNLIDLQTLQTRDARLLQEINRLVGDVNKQFGFEGKTVLTLGDIIGRSLDGTRGGERGLEGKNVLAPTSLDPLTFTAKLTPQQEQAIRALLDMKDTRGAGLDTHGAQRMTEMLGKIDSSKVETKGELAPKSEQKVDSKHELTGKELAGAKELSGRDLQGKELAGRDLAGKDLTGKELAGRDLAGKDLAGKDLAGKDLPGKDLTGKPDLSGKELAGKQELSGKDLGLRTELGVKGDLITKGEMANRPDQIIRPESKDSKDERGEKLDPHGPLGKHDGLGTNPDGTKKIRDEKELAEKQKDEKERLEEEQQRKDAALLALMADRKLREEKEKQQKEQEKLKDKKQDEDTRRRRYVVRERDSLESIATKQHRDAKLAPLILEINKKEIATKIVNGHEAPDLRARQVIWLPSEVDIREFRKRMHAGSSSHSANDGKLSAEDELTARFGSNWDGTASGDDTESGGSAGAPQAPPMTPEELAAAQTRRANIEKMLGPLSKQRPADGRIRYVVRLGDTLKTVAMKHPSLQDISLWPLLAEVNEISTETDEKGTPLAKLSRGSTVMIPTGEEIQQYREQHGTSSHWASKATKPCPQCGRLSPSGAAICGACAHSFNLDSKPAAGSDAGMVVMQAAGFVQKPGTPLAKRPAAPETTELEESLVAIPPPLYDENAQVAVVQLDEQTRLTRCMIHNENPSTIVVIEVSRDNAWKAVVAYEIFAQSSMRHEYGPRGDRKSVRIDLPTEAILELSNNDLKMNWKNYRDRYFAQLISLNR